MGQTLSRDTPGRRDCHRAPPDPPIPRAPEGRVPADVPDRRAQARPEEGRAGGAGSRRAKKKAAAGRVRLHYLDECGFRPSLPTGYSWCLPKQRKRVKSEYPQGRRVNALATYEPFAPVPGLDARPFDRTLTSDDGIAYLRELPGADVPRVVVLDNAGIHTSKVLKAARPWRNSGSTCTTYPRTARNSIGSSPCSSRSSITRCRPGASPPRPTCVKPSRTGSKPIGDDSKQKVTRNYG